MGDVRLDQAKRYHRGQLARYQRKLDRTEQCQHEHRLGSGSSTSSTLASSYRWLKQESLGHRRMPSSEQLSCRHAAFFAAPKRCLM
jgi:hypothetical protein